MTPTKTLVVGMMQTPPYDRMFEQSRRVYSAKGISPTLHTQGGGNQEIKVLVELWACPHHITAYTYILLPDNTMPHVVYKFE